MATVTGPRHPTAPPDNSIEAPFPCHTAPSFRPSGFIEFQKDRARGSRMLTKSMTVAVLPGIRSSHG